MEPKIQFSYHVDPKNRFRVLTIARVLINNGKEVAYGYAVCAPIRNDKGNRPRAFYVRGGDVHSKKMGRAIATARLHTGRTLATVRVPEGGHPLRSVLRDLRDNSDHSFMYRIAQHALDCAPRSYAMREIDFRVSSLRLR